MQSIHQQYVDAYVAAVKRHPDCYKERVRKDPEAAALSIIAGLSKAEIVQLLNDEKAEQRELDKHGV